MTYPVHVRERAIDMLSNGVSRALVSKDLGVKRVTLDKWIRFERLNNPGRIPKVEPRALLHHKVGNVRVVLSMLDDGHRMQAISRVTGIDRQTIRRWRLWPKYREATLEYDPLFDYDHNDLLDRAVVAQHLCTQTPDIGERLDLLMAAVGPPDLDEFSIPYRKTTRRKGA